MNKKRKKELLEIAARICEMNPKDVHLERANWMEEQGCRSMLDIYLVRNEVLERMVYGRGGVNE